MLPICYLLLLRRVRRNQTTITTNSRVLKDEGLHSRLLPFVIGLLPNVVGLQTITKLLSRGSADFRFGIHKSSATYSVSIRSQVSSVRDAMYHSNHPGDGVVDDKKIRAGESGGRPNDDLSPGGDDTPPPVPHGDRFPSTLLENFTHPG